MREAIALKELELRLGLEGAILARLSERVVVITPEAARALRERLAAQGRPPRVAR
ncbi:MAG: hypothetical protein HY722_11250 [Planctomycetes bacterium]|nr:hypothetical protein [Planctomycetota bacterium]